jgi:Fe-S-cluster containining protein
MNIENLLDETRKKVSEFCMNSCDAECCKGRVIVLSENEARKLTKGSFEEFLDLNYMKKIDENYLLCFGLKGQCLLLEKNRCSVYEDEDRPLACKKHPLYLDEKGKVLFVDGMCKAVKSGFIDELFLKFRKEKYLIETK